MSQLSLRISDELAEGLKSAARERDLSVNRYASAVLEAAIDPELGDTEMDRLRGRLAKAGLLEPSTSVTDRTRPSKARMDAARKHAGQGTLLSDLVAEDRR